MLALAVAALAIAASPLPAAPVVDGTTGAADAALDRAIADVVGLHLAAPRVADAKPPAPPRKSTSSAGTEHETVPQLAAAGAASTPQGRTFGVGLQLGYPTALTIKYMLRPDQGIVAGIGGFTGFAYDAGALGLHVDYVWHPNLLTQSDVYAVTWYVGGGGELMVINPRTHLLLPSVGYYYYPTNFWLAGRVPLGVNLALAQMPFEIYLEATPEVLLFPSIGFGLGASLGGRAYF